MIRQFFHFIRTASLADSTQPYRVPSISGVYEMCTAGGDDSKLYRLRLPLNPDVMVWGCCESFIGNDFSFSLVDESFMSNP